MRDADRATQYGVVPSGTTRTMSGLQLLTAITEGTLPAPPIQKTLDFRPVEVTRGYMVFAGKPKTEYYNPLGTVHGGYTAALLDSCMACAIHSTLEAGYSYATLEIKINYVRAITSETGELRAEGKVINSGRRIATAEGRLFDSAGKLYAHGTTTCLIVTL
ncbi:MAG: PaaI family thioesterase [Candidatus Acidiferrum sp.]